MYTDILCIYIYGILGLSVLRIDPNSVLASLALKNSFRIPKSCEYKPYQRSNALHDLKNGLGLSMSQYD